jgi:tRNA pseudouridine13 synthase
MTPTDFVVNENLGVDFTGDGEHDLLHIEKTAANTQWVSRQLAEFAGVPGKDVGYSGLKDRHALTRQWFSVPRWHAPDWSKLQIEGVSLLDVQRHSRKLRRGTHKSNSFRIVLHGPVEDEVAVIERLQRLSEQGVPNYFGEQRFGRAAGNIQLAHRWSEGARLPRHQRGLAISTARSFLFNEMLAQRVNALTWNKMRDGDVANLDGTASVFDVDRIDDDIVQRCGRLDIHPTGVLWGDGSQDSSVPEGFEQWQVALSRARVKPMRRSLRLPVRGFAWEITGKAVVLDFTLGRGSFATTVLREIADIVEADR